MASGWHIVASATLLVGGCGPRIHDPPLEELECRETARTSAGCSFVATPVLHVMAALGRLAEVPSTRWEPDGIVVANPGPRAVRIQPAAVRRGSTEAYALSEAFTLEVGAQRLIALPTFADGEGTELREGSLVRVDGDAPFVAALYGPYRPFLGNDSAMLLPRSAWGRDYVVASYPPHHLQFQGVGEPTFFEIVALEEETSVRWLARFAATAGVGSEVDEVAEGEWSREVVLRANEVLRVAASRAGDVSGSVIEASAPVSVLAGSRCSAVPPVEEAISGCDPLFEAAIPLALWGRAYAVPHPPARTDEEHYYRIYGGDAGVEITTSPLVIEPHVFASRGDYVDVVVPHGTSFAVTATGPVLPVGYLKTRDELQQVGDPAMYQLVPEEQWLERYVFATGVEWRTHLLQLVRRREGASPVAIDGSVIEGWEGFDAFEVAVVEIAEGAHLVDSEKPFAAMLFAWTNEVHDACVPYAAHGTCQTSYAHPIGMRTEPLWEP